jgi:8-oxo-dGTP pyrophosphatase MutT (NUDIX family)
MSGLRLELDPIWRARLAARADIAPRMPRAPLRTADAAHAIGSLEAGLAATLAEAGLLQAGESADPAEGWRLPATRDADAALAAIAHWLHANRIGGRWRDELLAVVDTAGGTTPVAVIERAAVRPLGIVTHAVHLVGRRASDGHVWVQQRAFDKATDPGQWDTMMGGLVSARESIAATLERETWEEAGLRIAELVDVRPFGRIVVRRPVSDGYMVEHIEMFEACVPDALMPRNQDGEVERFECMSPSELRARLHADSFTLEAALIIASLSHDR